jgi:adenylylsulfate kinase
MKALSWETFSNLVCLAMAYATFGNLSGCVIFTVVCFFVKLALFYGHERLWHQISYGKEQ